MFAQQSHRGRHHKRTSGFRDPWWRPAAILTLGLGAGVIAFLGAGSAHADAERNSQSAENDTPTTSSESDDDDKNPDSTSDIADKPERDQAAPDDEGDEATPEASEDEEPEQAKVDDDEGTLATDKPDGDGIVEEGTKSNTAQQESAKRSAADDSVATPEHESHESSVTIAPARKLTTTGGEAAAARSDLSVAFDTGSGSEPDSPADVTAVPALTAVERRDPQLAALVASEPVSKPATPNAPTASPAADSVKVGWTAPADGNAPITRYSLRYRLHGQTWTFASDATANARTAVITGLRPVSAYEFAVRASNTNGNSAWSSSTLTTTTSETTQPPPTPVPDTGPKPAPVVGKPVAKPSAPAAPTAAPAADSVTVRWLSPVDGNAAITRYSLRYREYGETWALAKDASPNARAAVITGLNPNTAYEVAVRASNALGNSAWSPSTVTATTGGTSPRPGDPPAPPPSGNVLWRDKFDSAANGRLNVVSGPAILGPTAAPTNGGDFAHASIHTDPDGGKFIRHSIPAGSLGPFIVSPKLTRDVEHAVLEYEVRFDDNFDWRWGGKLPGLVGVTPGISIFAPTSGRTDRTVGFSTRLMWHGRGDDGSRPFEGKLGPIPAGTDNQLVTYAYAPYPQPSYSSYGWQTSLKQEMRRGSWHRIAMEVRLNTVGSRNGVYRVWVDDKLQYSAADWEFRTRSDVKINAVLYDIHRGGGTTPPSWVSSRNTHIDIRNMVVRPG